MEMKGKESGMVRLCLLGLLLLFVFCRPVCVNAGNGDVTDGQTVYSVVSSGDTYEIFRTEQGGQPEKIASVKGFTTLCCVYNHKLYYTKEAGWDYKLGEVRDQIWALNLKTLKKTKVSSRGRAVDHSGKFLFCQKYVGTGGSAGLGRCYVLNVNNKKKTKIANWCWGGKLFGDKLYYLEGLHYGTSSQTCRVASYDLSSKKRKYLSKSYKVRGWMSVSEITPEYLIYLDANLTDPNKSNRYKCIYASGKRKKI